MPAAWRGYFESLGDPATEVVALVDTRRSAGFRADDGGRARQLRPARGKAPSTEKQAAVSRLIQVYSLRGHQIAEIDPLGLMERPVPGVLKLDYLGLTDSDMDSDFHTGGLAGTGNTRMKLRDILAPAQDDLLRQDRRWKSAHMSMSRERLWLRKRFEQMAWQCRL